MTSSATLCALKVYANAGLLPISPSATNPLLTRQGFAAALPVIGDDSLSGNCFTRDMAKKRYQGVALIKDRSSHGQPLPDCECKTIASPEPGNGPGVWRDRPLPTGPYRIGSTSR